MRGLGRVGSMQLLRLLKKDDLSLVCVVVS